MSKNPKRNVLVLFGGASSEHQVSCATAAGVLAAIDREKWNVIPVGITPDGEWVLQPDAPERYAIHDGAGYVIETGGPRVNVVTGESCITITSTDGSADRIAADVAFPLLHGPYGEDGCIQGLFEMSKMSYVGCGVAASAISMDKHFTKVVLAQAGIPVTDWDLLVRQQVNETAPDLEDMVARLGLPLFVKPCRQGSSMGVVRVDKAEDLRGAIDEAFKFDSRIIVESGAQGREIECGILQPADGQLLSSELGEITVTGAEFYDYKTKYFDPDAVSLRCPADLPESMATQLRAVAKDAFRAVGGEGLARVDFFCDPENGSYIVNEINTLPGFTPFSMYPTMMRETGIEYSRLIDTLLTYGISRTMGVS